MCNLVQIYHKLLWSRTMSRSAHLNHRRYLFSISLLPYDNISFEKKKTKKKKEKKLTKHQLKAIRFIHSSNRTLPHSNAFRNHVKRGTHNSLIISQTCLSPVNRPITRHKTLLSELNVDFSIPFLPRWNSRGTARSLLVLAFDYLERLLSLLPEYRVSFLFLRRESFRRTWREFSSPLLKEEASPPCPRISRNVTIAPPAENHHRDPQRGGRHRCNWPSYAPLLPVRKHRESDQPNRDDRRAGENKRLRGRLQVTKLRLSYA